MVEQGQNKVAEKSKQYSFLKYSLALIDTAYLVILLLIFCATNLSKNLAEVILNLSSQSYVVVPAYILVIGIGYYILSLPLNFYRTYTLEHKFSLSKQTLRDWVMDQIKSGIIAYLISIILIGAFYYILKRYPGNWWLIISLFWILFSIGFAKILPVVIIPLFFKYKKLSDEELRKRIFGLADKMKVRILDVFEIDFSKKTMKANAAFVGVGNTRRVILADTLKDKYSYNEIEVILTHEFAHYRLKHLLKLIVVNSLVTLALFYLVFISSDYVLGLFGLSSLEDIAALPVILLYFVLFGIITQPIENYISRRFEKNADKMAIAVTGLKDDFISTMDKLATQNLADRKPHPLIKFFFFDHPPIDERIALAK